MMVFHSNYVPDEGDSPGPPYWYNDLELWRLLEKIIEEQGDKGVSRLQLLDDAGLFKT